VFRGLKFQLCALIWALGRFKVINFLKGGREETAASAFCFWWNIAVTGRSGFAKAGNPRAAASVWLVARHPVLDSAR
jgi:hypothetical protein